MWNRRKYVLSLLGSLSMLSLLCAIPRAFGQNNVKAESELTTKDIGAKESAIGNYVADALRHETKADLSLIAASYFTSDLKFAKGDVSLSEFLKVLEYKDDSVSIVKLTGAQILKALEHGMYLFPKSNSGFLQFSGMVVTIDSDAEKEKRVLSVKIEGSSLENSKTYKVAMPTPLANGALAYFKIWKKDDIDKEASKKLEDKTLGSLITQYLKERKSIKSIEKGDERLIVKGKAADAR